jgi:SAM-dependent methyltransferase
VTRRLDLPNAAHRDAARGRLTSPAAARNCQAILDVVLPRLPPAGHVLEIASGTGQHVAALAAHRPDLTFQPTDPDPERREAIDQRCRSLRNVSPAGGLDACRQGWADEAAVEAVLIVNLLHLITDSELAILLDEVARALMPGGLLAIYGPFLRCGRPIGDGDRRFHESLRMQDPDVGYKDIAVLEDVLPALGLTVEVIAMPVNNLMALGRKRGPAL